MTTQATIGAAKVTALIDSEGPFFLPLADAFPTADPEAWAAARRIDPGPAPEPEVWWLAFRVYVVEVAGRVVLVDTGAASDTGLRPSWVPAGPHLTQRLLEELDIAALAVTDVVLTHLHRDHSAGSIDQAGGPAFPNATYHLQTRELDAVTSASDASELWRPLLDPLTASGRLRTWAGTGALPSTGGTTLHLEWTPGHTPGHQSLVVSAADDLLVLAGDVIVHAVQVADPATRYLFDDDDATAARTRGELLERLHTHSGRLGTAHLRSPFLTVP